MFAFLSFFHKVIHQCCITGHFHQSALSVEFSIQSAFNHTNSHWTVCQYLLTPIHSCIFQLGQWHYFVHHAHFFSFFCRVLLAKEPDFACFFLTHTASQV